MPDRTPATPVIARPARGSVAVEVIVATMVVAAMVIPLLSLLFQERDSEQLSRYEYAALLAARDEIGECRMAVAAGATADTLKHGWISLKGRHPMTRLKQANVAPGYDTSDITINYSPEQDRISTMLEVAATANPRLRVATVNVRWLDPSAVGSSNANRPTSLKLVFGILTPPWNP